MNVPFFFPPLFPLRQGLRLDRFGIFNHQLYHQFTKFFLSDLVVNGRPIDLDRDPQWQGVGNRAVFREKDFQRQDFGYTPGSRVAGGGAGELGGLFSRTAWDDPNHGTYADDVGTLTLDDPVSFSGKLGFPWGYADSGLYLGYWSAAAQRRPPANADEARTVRSALGIVVEATGGRGFDFSALASPPGAAPILRFGRAFAPREEPYAFRFAYDPKGGDGFGQVRFALDGAEPALLNLTRAQRQSSATFDRFGVMSRRVGGTHLAMYFDDLSYTARRPPGWTPVRHDQKTFKVPFPMGGRDR